MGLRIPVFKNSKNEIVRLNRAETAVAEYWQDEVKRKFAVMMNSMAGGMDGAGEFQNDPSLGFNISITSLTTIVKAISEQKFYKVPFGRMIPVRVGQGAWSLQLTTFLSYNLGDKFESGIIGTGHGGARLAGVDAGVSPINVPVINWCKGNGYNIFELNLAMRAGNWDLVAAKEQARKENFDLGIQELAFLGLAQNSNVYGLLNQPDVNYNTARIFAALSQLTPEDYGYFCQGILDDYRSNANRTAWPTDFLMTESDYLGLGRPVSDAFPVKSRLALLKEVFNTLIYGDANADKFNIWPCAYADQANSGYAYQQYVLYNQDEKSLRMDLPVPYTSTLMNTINGFQFENAAYAQFTGVKAYRPLEMLYFKF